MHAIPIPKPATADGTSPQLGGYFFLKRQDHRISVIGGFILAVLTLAAGISVFVVMQRQAESLLSKSLEASLQSVERARCNAGREDYPECLPSARTAR